MGSTSSVKIAKERLKTLLTADRINCTPDTAEKLSMDIYHTVSKYMEVSPEDFEVRITRSDIHIKYTGEKY